MPLKLFSQFQQIQPAPRTQTLPPFPGTGTDTVRISNRATGCQKPSAATAPRPNPGFPMNRGAQAIRPQATVRKCPVMGEWKFRILACCVEATHLDVMVGGAELRDLPCGNHGTRSLRQMGRNSGRGFWEGRKADGMGHRHHELNRNIWVKQSSFFLSNSFLVPFHRPQTPHATIGKRRNAT